MKTSPIRTIVIFCVMLAACVQASAQTDSLWQKNYKENMQRWKQQQKLYSDSMKSSWKFLHDSSFKGMHFYTPDFNMPEINIPDITYPAYPHFPSAPAYPGYNNSGEIERLKEGLERLEMEMRTLLPVDDDLVKLLEELEEMKYKLDEIQQMLNSARRSKGQGNNEIIIVDPDTSGKVYKLGNMKLSYLDKTDLMREHDSIEKKKRAPKNVQSEWLHADIGFNSYLFNGDMNLPNTWKNLSLNSGKSINFNLHIFDQRVNILKHKLWLGYGLGLDYNHYRFSNGNFAIDPDSDTLAFLSQTIKSDRNKLRTQYLMLPLNFQFQSGRKADKSFKASAGVFAAYLLSAKTKQVSDEEGKKTYSDDYNIEKFRYGVNMRIGYGRFVLYANYSLTPLFSPGRGPELHPVAVGLQVYGF